MKKFFYLTLTLVICLHSKSNAQCPSVPACTQTAVSGTNYTVTASDVLCINTNYTSGTITVNGGTVIIQSGGTLNSTISMTSGTINVASGGTLSKNLAPTAASIVNNCGTIAAASDYNTNVTLNNYSSTTLSLKYGGNIVNNYAANATISFGTVDVSGGVVNNFASNFKFSITGSWNQGITFNNTSGTMEITAVPGGSMPASTVFNNNSGTLTYTPVLNTTGATFNNAAGATLNFTSAASANKPNINNNGTMNVTGTFYLAGGTTTNNGKMNFSSELRLDGGTLNINANSTVSVNSLYKNNGTLNMGDHSLLNIATNITTWNGTPINLTSGCASIMASTQTSNNAINNPFLNNANLNFCGSAPADASGCHNAPTAMVDNGSGAFRITIPTCGTMPTNLQYVEIYGATYTALNGLWRVTLVSAGVYDLIGSTFNSTATTAGMNVISEQSKIKMGTGNYLGYSGCTNPCAPLPIKLVAFTAVKENNAVRIGWQTIEEKNNDYYTIERSTDGINFETVTTIRGNRNSSSVINYTEYDYSPYSGVSYYRLKQVDLNGAFTYSNIAAVEFESQADWVIYPNPSIDGSFTITSTFSENEVITVTVTDVTGNRVRYYDSSLYAQEMQVSDLSSGLYIVSIQTVSELLSKKLVVR